YFFRASGDSPELGIGNGDILVVDRSLNPVEGDVAIVIKDNTLRLKEITSSDIASWVNGNTKTTSTQEKSDLSQEWQEDFFGIVTWIIRKVKIKRTS
ncbi:MAG: S24 family peptidase, partial [Acetomicrobium sp.]